MGATGYVKFSNGIHVRYGHMNKSNNLDFIAQNRNKMSIRISFLTTSAHHAKVGHLAKQIDQESFYSTARAGCRSWLIKCIVQVSWKGILWQFTFSASVQACSMTDSCAPQPTRVMSLPSLITWYFICNLFQIYNCKSSLKGRTSIPLLLTMATYNHAQGPLLLPTGKATSNKSNLLDIKHRNHELKNVDQLFI